MGKKTQEEQLEVPDRLQVRLTPSEQKEFYSAWKELRPETKRWADFCRDMVKKGISLARLEQEAIERCWEIIPKTYIDECTDEYYNLIEASDDIFTSKTSAKVAKWGLKSIPPYILEELKEEIRATGVEDVIMSIFNTRKQLSQNFKDKALLTQKETANSELEIHEPTPVYGSSAKEGFGDSIDYIDVIEIPMLGSTAAGKRIDFGDLDPNPPKRPWATPLIKGDKKNYYCILVKGTSMTESDIEDGDYALLKYAKDAENGEIMLVRHDDSSTLKRIKIENGKNGREDVYICWEDGTGHTEKLEGEGFEIQGKLVAIERNKRRKK